MVPMATDHLGNTSVQDTEIRPHTLDVQNKRAVRSEHTLTFEELADRLDPLPRHTDTDYYRRSLRSTESLGQLIRATVFANELFDHAAIPFLQIFDTCHDYGIGRLVLFESYA